MPRNRRVYSIAKELIEKSRESALAAIQIFNNPLMLFKSESYIVLMIIAWTYLLHAYYKSKKIEYRYFDKKNSKRSFKRTKSKTYRYWDLSECISNESCPLDRGTVNNLRFLIELRHEIEHQMTMRLDNYVSGRYQACAMNYNRYVKALFGDKFGIDMHLTYSIQLLGISYEQMSITDHSDVIPENLRNFIAKFDSGLSQEEFNDEVFSYRLRFTKKMVNQPGQADKVIEFVAPDSETARHIARERWVKKEVEKPKLLPKTIVQKMRAKGFTKFSMSAHTKLWKSLEARKAGKGYGVMVANTWYWYESWLTVVEKYCQDNEAQYK
jgi:hypothetical protein